MIILEKCPLCNGVSFTKKMTCTDHTTSKEKFSIVSCETCDFTFTNPRPLESKLAKYYDSEMYISHTNNSQGAFNWMYQNVRTHTIRTKVKLLKSIKRSGAHLDIGCGTGEFLASCRDAGFTVQGIEPSEVARKKAIKNHSLPVSKNTELSEYPDSKFDSISMWHVLEHVSNLNEMIAQFYRVLSPEGKIIIAVPNHESWDAEYYKTHWAAWDVPIHLWHFSQNTIEELFKKHRLILIQKKPMIFDSYYVSFLSEEFVSGKKNFIKGAIIGFISNIFGLLTKRGHSSIIYVFEKEK